MKIHTFKLKPAVYADYKVPRIICNGRQRCHIGIAARYWHDMAKYRRYRNLKPC